MVDPTLAESHLCSYAPDQEYLSILILSTLRLRIVEPFDVNCYSHDVSHLQLLSDSSMKMEKES